MRTTVSVLLIGAAALMAASASAQTAKKPVQTQATNPATTKAAANRPAARPSARPAPRAAVYVPPPPVLELDEAAVVADLPTVLDNETRARYRRIFQAQQSGAWAQADDEIRQLSDKTLMGYVGAQRLLSPNYPARYEQLAAWLQDYNDNPDAPAIYRLALARRTPGGAELTPATFVGFTQGSPNFAAARTVNGADGGRAAELRSRLQSMADDGGFNAAFVLLDRKSSTEILGPQEVELWRGRLRTRQLEADPQRGVQIPVEASMPPDANWNAAMTAFTRGDMAEAARRFELVADASPDRASSWTLSAGSFWAARANLLAGNPQKYAPYLKRAALHGSTFYGLVAQKALGMQIQPDFDVPPLELGGVILAGQDLVIAVVCAVLVVAFFVFFAKTRLGKLMQAASQVPRGAALVGINVPRFHCLMWGAASATAAVAGALVAPVTMLYPDMGAHLLIKAFAAMALGGFGHLGGAVVGGLLIGVSEQLAGGYVSTAMIDTFAYFVIIVTLLALPNGLFGKKELARV